MIKSTRLLFPVCMGAMLSLGACATAPAANEATTAPKVEQAAVMPEKAAVVETTKETSAETDSGKLICKRQTVVGSNFKRKVCGTAEQWDAAAEKGSSMADVIQRSKATGTSN